MNSGSRATPRSADSEAMPWEATASVIVSVAPACAHTGCTSACTCQHGGINAPSLSRFARCPFSGSKLIFRCVLAMHRVRSHHLRLALRHAFRRGQFGLRDTLVVYITGPHMRQLPYDGNPLAHSLYLYTIGGSSSSSWNDVVEDIVGQSAAARPKLLSST